MTFPSELNHGVIIKIIEPSGQIYNYTRGFSSQSIEQSLLKFTIPDNVIKLPDTIESAKWFDEVRKQKQVVIVLETAN